MSEPSSFGRTIQLFLVDGSANGLMVATLHGWTGSVLVCKQATFDRLLKRSEIDRTGVYILYGPDPDNTLKMRAYIGEADCVKDRIGQSAGQHGFWESAVAVTTSDDALTKGHVRYLEARLWELSNEAGRVTLANSQQPGSDRRRLPEADRANMELFLSNLKTVLPVVGLDLLKPQSKPVLAGAATSIAPDPSVSSFGSAKFEIRHKSGVKAFAVEEGDEFVVLAGSEALKDTGYVQLSYGELKQDLLQQGVLKQSAGDRYIFQSPFAFRSPSAAAAVILDRNANGRIEWKVVGQRMTYHEWQGAKSEQPSEAAA